MAEQVLCELTSSDIPGALTAMHQRGADIRDVVETGEMTIRFFADKESLPEIQELVDRRGDRLRLLRRVSIIRRLIPAFRHPLLLSVIAILLTLTIWLPTRVLFIRVEGNSNLPVNLILSKAEACGIRFGSLRSEVRSERMKNALLEALPQLQWAGINTSGCVATITVRERSEAPEDDMGTATAVVAARDGVIRSCEVSRGTALCAPGQAVRAGEVLISGLTDCGLAILGDRAEGEVFAETSRQILGCTPDTALYRTGEGVSAQKFSLLIGKKRINFYNDSGILDTSCVKMYSEYYITLPGGFALPMGIGVETRIAGSTAEDSVVDTDGVLTEYARRYLLSHMTAGQILREQITADGNRLFADYICLEMIGQNRYEEIRKVYGENYGENG